MRIYVQSVDYELWRIIVKGPKTPTIKIEGKDEPKPESTWDENDLKMLQSNSKAMNILYCALDANEYNRISSCESAKEIWDRLEVTHEGTSQVKESKINMLVHNYELFRMKTDESITEMFTRFTDIINGLKSLGKVYPNNEQVRKILRSLPKAWEAKVTAIQEAKDLNTLALDELLGSLMTYELTQKQRAQDDEETKRKPVAFKSTTQEDESSSEEDDGEMALITRKFKRFMKKKWRGGKRHDGKGEANKESTIICYECNKPGHMKAECPLLKKKEKKEK